MALTFPADDFIFWPVSGGDPSNVPATASTGGGSATIYDTNEDNQIDATDYMDFMGDSWPYTGVTVTINGSDYAVFEDVTMLNNYIVPFNAATDNLTSFTDTSTWTFNSVATDAAVVNCFLGGTRIRTPDGETAVEDLGIGDALLTPDGRTVTVRWIARQTYRQVRNMDLPEKHAPICIGAGALEAGVPHSDLYLTADHGMIVDDLVINASALVNHATIRRVPLAEMPGVFTYYHVETEDHDEILANGAPAETFIDFAGRRGCDNYPEYIDLYGHERIIPEMTRLRISAQRQLPPDLRARLGIGEDVCQRSLLTAGYRAASG